MSKKLTEIITLEIPAQQVNPGPPIATALGPRGVNLGVLCKQLNDSTKEFDSGARVRVKLKIFDDRSTEFDILGYTTRYLILKAAKIDGGSAKPGRESKGVLTKDQVREIAEKQINILNAYDLDAAIRIVSGSVRSMGILMKG